MSLSLGTHTHSIPSSLFKNNRTRVAKALRDSGTIKNEANSFIILKGGTEEEYGFYDTDTTQTTFRQVNYNYKYSHYFVFVFLSFQESYFTYLFGVIEPDFFGIVRVSDGYTTLFAPHLTPDYEVWMGPIATTDDIKLKYGVDEVFYTEDIVRVLADKKTSLLLTLAGVNSDSGKVHEPATFEGIEKFAQDAEILFPILAECRGLCLSLSILSS